MDGVGTFRWHQVTFFLRFVTLSRRSVTPARRLVTYRGTAVSDEMRTQSDEP